LRLNNPTLGFSNSFWRIFLRELNQFEVKSWNGQQQQ
jgi:hypothetical protein